jgi:predicted TIM-barrel enzyme
MWSHPHVQLASYTQEHPSANEIIVRCQTTGVIPAEQAVVEALHMTKEILTHIGATMDDAVARWEQQHGPVGGSSRQQAQQGAPRVERPKSDEDMEEAS